MEQPKEEEAMEGPVCNGYTICTGGAVGTDSIAEQCARELGMNIEVMIPPDHVRAKTITPLSQSMLEKEAEPFLNAAAQSLGRNLSHMSRYTKNLLARNY